MTILRPVPRNHHRPQWLHRLPSAADLVLALLTVAAVVAVVLTTSF